MASRRWIFFKSTRIFGPRFANYLSSYALTYHMCRLSITHMAQIVAGLGLRWSQCPFSLSATSFDRSKLVTRYHTTAFPTQALQQTKMFRKSATIFRKRLCRPICQIGRETSMPHQFVILYQMVQHMQTWLALSTISDMTLVMRQIMVLHTAVAPTLMTRAKQLPTKRQILTLAQTPISMVMTSQWMKRNSLWEQKLWILCQ
jgi:hypothetical protein